MRCTTLWSSSASLPLMAASQHCLSSSTDVQPASAIVQTGLEPQVSLSYGGQSSGRCCCAASSAIVERRRIPGQRASVDASPDCDVRPVIDLPDRRTYEYFLLLMSSDTRVQLYRCYGVKVLRESLK